MLAAALLTACAGPGYYAQAIGGHFELVRGREDVEQLLGSSQAPAGLRRDLELALEIRRFASERLGLPDNDSYSHYVSTGRDAVTWNVVAAPELSLQPRRWCFLFAGCLPYRGYFQRADAERFANSLAADGLDVALSPAVAYSTLGWFEDPLLDTMFRHGEVRLAALIFHELAHQRLFVKGDAAFSESYASFVEEAGVDLWLRESGREGLARWRREREAAGQFDRRILQTRDELAQLYASSATAAAKREGKQAAFDDLRRDYRSLVEGPWQGTDFFGGWFAQPLNNARLALFDSYRGGLCAFAALHDEAGGDMAHFHALAEARAGLAPEARRAWLRQDCRHVASRNDL